MRQHNLVVSAVLRRTLFVVGITSVPGVLSGCHQGSVAGRPAPRSELDCADGEPYLDVVNRTSIAFDVYAMTYDGTRVYIGAASPSTTRISLVGTPLEHASGSLYAVPPGQTGSVSINDLKSPITLRRRCDRSTR